MEISRKSWAYKIWKWNNKYYDSPNDLCSFVRGLVWSVVKHVGLVVFAVAAGSFLLFGVISPFLYSWFGQVGLEAPAVVMFMFYSIAALFYFATLIHDAIRDARYNRVELYKEPGLVRSWYRAKKQKICPFITVKD